MRSRLLGIAMSFFVLGGQALSGIPAAAASAPGAPTVVQELKHDRSGPLRSAQPVQAPNDLGNRNYHSIRPRGLSPKGALPPGPVQTAAGPSAMPSTSANFEGISNLDKVLPPDTNGDIGPNHYVQWVNLRYQIFSRTGTSLLGPSAGNTLWSGFGGVCQTTNQGDPVVRYDRMADRWVFTQFAFNVDGLGYPIAPYIECLAVSTTGDPTGSYYRYAYQISSTLFNDYPKLSVWPDGYYMTFNYFNGNTFVGAGAWAFDRSKMLNGLAANAVNFQTTSTYGGLLASDLDGSILPPTGSPNYVAAIDNPVSGTVALAGSTLFIWKFHVDWTMPANSTFGTAAHTPDYNLAVASYKWDPCGASQNCIPQPGTRIGLDPIADRLMNRLQYRHFADGHESLVANHTVGVGTSGNQAAIRWYEIRNLSTTPTIYQQGTYSPDANNRWMGSLAMDQSGDIGLGYSVSSSTVSPSIRYTGRLPSDPLGSLPQGEATMVAGSGSQISTYYRWGDYSRMAVDPTDDCTFWYTQEYYTTTSDRGWRTRIGSFKFPGCGPPLTLSVPQASNINSNSSVITWQTSNPADSRVDFGTTSAYGSSTSDAARVTNHSITLGGLATDTTYHIRATSRDGFAQSASSTDTSFRTQTNLLANGGFESGSSGWNLATQTARDTNPADAHTGNNSLTLVATGQWQATTQAVTVTAGQIYSFAGWGRSTSSGGEFALVSYDTNWAYLGQKHVSFPGTGSWVPIATNYTAPASAVRLVVAAQNYATGTFWFDDLSVSPSSNLLVNGSFEMASAAWSLPSQASIDTSPGDAHSGSNSLTLAATGQWQATTQAVPVTAGQMYNFAGWGRSTSSGGEFALVSYDTNWAYLGQKNVSFPGTGSWVPIATNYTAPASAVHLLVAAQNYATGTFWFDDLSLSPTSNLLINGSFEMGSAAWSLPSQASIDTSPGDAHSGSNSLTLVATGQWQATTQAVTVTAGQIYSFAGWGRSTSSGGEFALVSYDTNWAYLGQKNVGFSGTGSWVPIATNYTAPASAVHLVVAAQNYATGTFWFDDLNLTK